MFKSELGQETYAKDEEILVFSPGSSNSCGAWVDFGEEYLVDLRRSDDGLYAVLPCGIYRTWVTLSEDDEESLRTCTCDGACGTFRVCIYEYTSLELVDIVTFNGHWESTHTVFPYSSTASSSIVGSYKNFFAQHVHTHTCT